MIERTGGQIVFHCDECPETFESDEDNFPLAWGAAKAEGWRSYKLKSEWMHSCPACVEEFKERQ